MSSTNNQNQEIQLSPEVRQYFELQQQLQVLQDPANLHISQYLTNDKQSQTVTDNSSINTVNFTEAQTKEEAKSCRQKFKEMMKQRKQEFHDKYHKRYDQSQGNDNNTQINNEKHCHSKRRHCHCQCQQQNQQNNQNNNLNQDQSNSQQNNANLNSQDKQCHLEFYKHRGFCHLQQQQNQQQINSQNLNNGFQQQTSSSSQCFFKSQWNQGDQDSCLRRGPPLPLIVATGLALFVGFKFTKRAFHYMRAQRYPQQTCNWWGNRKQ